MEDHVQTVQKLSDMEKINVTPDTVFHSLSHFEKIDDMTRNLLSESGYVTDEIDSRLAGAGSKFHASFARSPREVLEQVERLSPVVFDRLPEPDKDGRIRISVDAGRSVGTDSIIDMSELDRDELQTLRTDVRNDCVIRKVRISRTCLTSEIQIVLEADGDGYALITIYPGVKAPPLPKDGGSDPFWDRHCFIEHER